MHRLRDRGPVLRNGIIGGGHRCLMACALLLNWCSLLVADLYPICAWGTIYPVIGIHRSNFCLPRLTSRTSAFRKPWHTFFCFFFKCTVVVCCFGDTRPQTFTMAPPFDWDFSRGVLCNNKIVFIDVLSFMNMYVHSSTCA